MKKLNIVLTVFFSLVLTLFVATFICCNQDEKKNVPFGIPEKEVVLPSVEVWVEQGSDIPEYRLIVGGEELISRIFFLENQSNIMSQLGFIQYKVETDHRIYYTEDVELEGWIPPSTTKQFNIKSFGYNDFFLPFAHVDVTISSGSEYSNQVKFTLKK